MRTTYLPLLFALHLAASAGCSASTPMDAGTDDAGTGMDASPDLWSPYPAPFPAPPQVLNPNNGAVLVAPVVVPIFFANDDPSAKAELSDFISKVGATNYWTAVAAEYGVGALTASAPIELAESAAGTLTGGGVVKWLQTKLNADDPTFPSPTANTLYVIHYPASTTITMPGPRNTTSTSCVNFGGYHGETALDDAHSDQPVVFAVLPRCTRFNGLMGLDATTAAESHELIEASTDPFPQSDPAFQQPDDNHVYWAIALGGGEVGDMCSQWPSSFIKPADLPSYYVQRSWSNASVLAGHDPCVPVPSGEVYFATVPELNDPLQIVNVTSLGAQIPVGSKQTIALDLYSDANTNGLWTVKVEDLAAEMGGSANLSFSLNKNAGTNGDKLQLTITSEQAGLDNVAAFFVQSKMGAHTNTWIGLVGQ